MDKKEIYSFYQGMKLLEKEGIKIYGLYQEDGTSEWHFTSEQYPPYKTAYHEGKMIKVGWHCHGTGKTPKDAIVDMIKQVKKYLKNK